MNLFRKRYLRAVLAVRKTVSEELRRDEFATVEDRSIDEPSDDSAPIHASTRRSAATRFRA
jgi:hypothetical protein